MPRPRLTNGDQDALCGYRQVLAPVYPAANPLQLGNLFRLPVIRRCEATQQSFSGYLNRNLTPIPLVLLSFLSLFQAISGRMCRGQK